MTLNDRLLKMGFSQEYINKKDWTCDIFGLKHKHNEMCNCQKTLGISAYEFSKLTECQKKQLLKDNFIKC